MACCPSISLPLEAAVISLQLCFSCSPRTSLSIPLWAIAWRGIVLPGLVRAVLRGWGFCDPYLRDPTLLVCLITACPSLISFFQLPVEQLVETL